MKVITLFFNDSGIILNSRTKEYEFTTTHILVRELSASVKTTITQYQEIFKEFIEKKSKQIKRINKIQSLRDE